jgi:hypothetical protein
MSRDFHSSLLSTRDDDSYRSDRLLTYPQAIHRIKSHVPSRDPLPHSYLGPVVYS